MKFIKKVSNVGVGTLQFLAAGIMVAPAFMADVVRYMWQNRASPFSEDNDSDDPPLHTPFTDKVIAFKDKGLEKLISVTDGNISDENKSNMAKKYARLITSSLKFLIFGFITGVAIAGAVATFPIGLLPLSFVIIGGSYGVANAGKKWIGDFKEASKARSDAHLEKKYGEAVERSAPQRAQTLVHSPAVAAQASPKRIVGDQGHVPKKQASVLSRGAG